MDTKPLMVVEDNAINGKIIRLLLSGAGYEVQLVPTAEEALQALTTWLPKVILMDIQLPGMSGLELTRQLKSNAKTNAIKIIALTAYAMKGDEAKALEAGCDGYITKPIDFQACLAQVAKYWATSA